MRSFRTLAAVGLALLCLAAIPSCALLEDEESSSSETPPARARSYNVEPIRNKSITVRVHNSFTYRPKDESTARAHLPDILLARLNAEGSSDGNTFEFANGVKPNMIVTVTVHNDNDNNYTASAHVVLYQSDQFFTVSSGDEPYRDPQLMINALVKNLYVFIHNGFHRN